MIKNLCLLWIAIFAITAKLCAQVCPENIGFENGNFQNWKIYTGTTSILNSKNSVKISEVGEPVSLKHQIISDKNLTDPYGEFKIVPPNGGDYVVKLGNDGTGNQADAVSYVISVPANRPEFTLTYQYAVVLEDPGHLPDEQPRFIARVKDLEKNEYIKCASFEYIAVSNLPGFQKSQSKETIIYKDWTPVTINLSGYQGKKIQLEFISADCTLGGHFGYAYVDVNNICSDVIIGNDYCKSADHLEISGPSGFQSYQWYNGDRTVKYGSGQTLLIKPAPVEGSKILLDLVPYNGFGCPSTISAVVHSIDYQVDVLNHKVVCKNTLIDLTSADFIFNKSAQFSYLVFEDKDLTRQVKGEVLVDKNATYYIKATNYKGCESFATISLSINDLASVKIKNPDSACYNESIDITLNQLYEGNLEGVERSYFTDANAINPIANPKQIKSAGIYYIKFTNTFGCTNILPITAAFHPKPVLKITDHVAVCVPHAVDITANTIYAGSDSDLTYLFFEDQALTIALSNPQKIGHSGIYYVQATNSKGCKVSGSIHIIIDKAPQLVINNPSAVCAPQRVDITAPSLYSGSSAGLSFSFFKDESLNNPIANPIAIEKSGIYYVKATNSSGCSAVGTIQVTINSLPTLVVNAQKIIFETESVDLTSAEVILGSKNYTKVSYFSDAALTQELPNPKAVKKAGLYYISLTNETGCTVSAPIKIGVLPQPKIVVPTAFTPHKETNNRLYPFLVSMQKLLSFKVFNKWGILVYQTSDANASGWNGEFKSKMQPIETFSWYAEGIDVLGNKYQSTGKTILIL